MTQIICIDQGPPTLDFTDIQVITNPMAIGEERPDRYVFAFVYASRSSSFTLSSATIGGVTAKIHTQRTEEILTIFYNIALISALVPTGTTATIVPTYSGTPSSGVGAVYRVTGLVSDTAITTNNSLINNESGWNRNIDVQAYGFVLANLFALGPTPRTVTCAQMTADNSSTDEYQFDVWSSQEDTTQSGKTFSWTTSNSDNNYGPFLAASFR